MAPVLVLDTREHALIRELHAIENDARERNYAPRPEKDSDFVVETLSLGDVEIRDGETYNLYERKTLQDLAQSIPDKRYRAQKARLRDQMLQGVRIEYILEIPHAQRRFLNPACRDTNYCNTGMSAAALRGAVYNTQCRDQMHVKFTDDTRDTARYIYEHWSRALRFVSTKRDRASEQLDITAHKKRRRDNATAHTRFVAMLCCAPGVSHGTASLIATHFGSLAALLDVYRKYSYDGDEKERKRICKLIYKDVKGVGPKIAYAVWAMLMGHEL